MMDTFTIYRPAYVVPPFLPLYFLIIVNNFVCHYAFALRVHAVALLFTYFLVLFLHFV